MNKGSMSVGLRLDSLYVQGLGTPVGAVWNRLESALAKRAVLDLSKPPRSQHELECREVVHRLVLRPVEERRNRQQTRRRLRLHLQEEIARIAIAREIGAGVGDTDTQNAARLEHAMPVGGHRDGILEREVLQEMLVEDGINGLIGERKRAQKVPAEVDGESCDVDVDPSLLSDFLRTRVNAERSPLGKPPRLPPLPWPDGLGDDEAEPKAQPARDDSTSDTSRNRVDRPEVPGELVLSGREMTGERCSRFPLPRVEAHPKSLRDRTLS